MLFEDMVAVEKTLLLSVWVFIIENKSPKLAGCGEDFSCLEGLSRPT